jgi:hypothetical protein
MREKATWATVVDLDRNATSTDVTALPALGTCAAVTPQ